MGMDTYAPCRCWSQGATAPLPSDVPPGAVAIDDEDGIPYLTLPYEGYEHVHESFDGWKQHACSHADFLLAQEAIANKMAWGQFCWDIERANAGGMFPVFAGVCGGQQTIAPEALGAALEELERLRHMDLGTYPALVRLDDEDDPGRYVGRIRVEDGLTLGCDEGGLFVHDDTGREVFRSSHVRARILDPGRSGLCLGAHRFFERPRRYELQDLEALPPGNAYRASALPDATRTWIGPIGLPDGVYGIKHIRSQETIVENLHAVLRPAFEAGSPVFFSL